MVGAVRVVEVIRVIGVVEVIRLVGVVWVLRTKRSQEEEEGLYLLLDHAAGGW